MPLLALAPVPEYCWSDWTTGIGVVHAESGSAAAWTTATLYDCPASTLAVLVEGARLAGLVLGPRRAVGRLDWPALLEELRAAPPPVGPGLESQRDAVDRAIGHLRGLDEDQLPSLSALAEVAGLSRFHFLRVFQAHTGLTPYRYYQQLRLSRARLLLREGTGVAATAFRLGYSDQSHFTRDFRASSAITPARYAAAVRDGEPGGDAMRPPPVDPAEVA